jgi:endoglucanase
MTARPECPPRHRVPLRHRLLVAASVLVTVPALIPGGAADAAPAVQAQVRVDQAGYVTGAAKRAYLMTSTAQPGAVFSVVDARGHVAASSVVGADQGSWSVMDPTSFPPRSGPRRDISTTSMR